MIEPCLHTCGGREIVISGSNVGERFGKWLFQINHKGFTVIAHSFRSYDSYFIMKYLMEQGIIPQNIIYIGFKLNYLKIGKGLQMLFLDSMNFLPISLANLPEAFNLQELCKGYWPHYFNTLENQNYADRTLVLNSMELTT